MFWKRLMFWKKKQPEAAPPTAAETPKPEPAETKAEAAPPKPAETKEPKTKAQKPKGYRGFAPKQ